MAENETGFDAPTPFYPSDAPAELNSNNANGGFIQKTKDLSKGGRV
jgi:hypothetical protein